MIRLSRHQAEERDNVLAAMVEGRDISGCATAELAAVFHRYKPKGMDSRAWVNRHIPEWDERDFEKIVEQQKYPWVGLGIVDRVLTALRLNLNTLTETGEITIVPSNNKGAAAKMVREEIAATLEEEIEAQSLSEQEVAALVKQQMRAMGEDEIRAREERLRNLRIQHCAESPEQRAILARDAIRTKERRQRLEAQDAAA